MPKKAKELTALEVSRLEDPGKHNVGSGIYLEIKGGSKSWILRTTVGGKRRSIGLGSYPFVTLAQARDQAREHKKAIAKGIDPIEQKKAAKSALAALQAKEVTFEQCAHRYLDTHAQSWKNLKHTQNWIRSLELYAFPHIGSLLVRDIEQPQILNLLKPIWTTKTDTAQRVRNRIEAVLDYAVASGYMQGENPARWKGRLDKLLPAPSKIQKVQHHEALPIDQMPEFVRKLSVNPSQSDQCLLLLILTATRSGEVREAQWEEIDLEAKLWTIPAERMKAGKEHQIPLSDEAITLLLNLPRVLGTPYLFPSTKGKPFSDMTLSMRMRRMGCTAVPHGFRSTFRDWAGDRTNYPRDIAEAALAHTLGNRVEVAYRRSTALEKRRKMMQEWAHFICSEAQSTNSAQVIQLKKA